LKALIVLSTITQEYLQQCRHQDNLELLALSLPSVGALFLTMWRQVPCWLGVPPPGRGQPTYLLERLPPRASIATSQALVSSRFISDSMWI
jgi:hypothetical protein